MHGRSGVYSIQPHRTGTDRLGIRPSTISSDQIHRFLSQNKAKSIIWARQAGTHYFIRLAWSKLIDPRCWVLHVAAALAEWQARQTNLANVRIGSTLAFGPMWYFWLLTRTAQYVDLF